MHVLGRPNGTGGTSHSDGTRPAGHLGVYRARDGSDGAAVGIDLDRPHAGLVVGKRGSGKSHTLGVLGEELLRTKGAVPVVLDPMGGLSGLADSADRQGSDGTVGPTLIRRPTVRADAVPPSAWPALFGIDATGPVGSLLWRVASEAGTLEGMGERITSAETDETTRRGARNHLTLADSWGVFDPDGIVPDDLLGGGAVIDLSRLAPAPANAVARAVVRGLYETCVRKRPEALPALPWLLVDEAHAFLDGIAAPALRTVLTRGRAPGVSLVLATQRPGALPSVAISQADLLVAHRLTAGPDVSALAAATPTYLQGSLRDRLPTERGCAVVVDDATESVHGVRVRDRRTPRGGESRRASSVGAFGDSARGDGGGTEMPE